MRGHLAPPSPPGVSHSGVWGVVAAAAIAAMHYGRKNLIRLHLGREELRGAGQTLITSYFPHVSGPSQPTVLQCAERGAVALLLGFASGLRLPQYHGPSGMGQQSSG